MEKTVLYIGNFQFPLGDAVAKRVHGIGQALIYAGYRPVYIGVDSKVSLGEISEQRHLGMHTYYALHKPVSPFEYYSFKDLHCVTDTIEEYRLHTELAAVIFCGMKNSFFANRIVGYCKKKSIPAIADSMDWLSSNTGNFVFDAIKRFDISYEIKHVNRRADGVIAISEYLKKEYEKQGIPTICIPPLSPYTREMGNFYRERKRVRLIYAGVPCRPGKALKKRSDAKDRLDLVMEALYSVSEKNDQFVFDVYGMTLEAYMTILPEHRDIVEALIKRNVLVFHGYADESIVKKAVEEADFTILLREKNRVSMAGFPTKISESIHLGTPVITTDTSDITNYVQDGTDAIIVELENFEKTIERLYQVISSSSESRLSMKTNAYANVNFEPQTYVDRLRAFLRHLENKK